MPNPFLYPQIRHRRKLSPPTFSTYRQYKPFLREEFNKQCVYCRALDRIKGSESFGVDHYRPVKHYPSLALEYLNLYYACNRCNALKRDFWPTLRQFTVDKVFIPNPCEHVMFEHMRYKGGTVAAVSSAGEFTVERLDLNDPSAAEFREGLIRALLALDGQIKVAEKTVREVNKLFKAATKPAERARLKKELDLGKAELRRLEEMRRLILG